MDQINGRLANSRQKLTALLISTWIGGKKLQSTGGLCSDTFISAVRPTTIRTVLSIVVSLLATFTATESDAWNEFLHGYLKDVYDSKPGNVDTHFLDHVCKHNKDLYGLKKTPRAW